MKLFLVWVMWKVPGIGNPWEVDKSGALGYAMTSTSNQHHPRGFTQLINESFGNVLSVVNFCTVVVPVL